MKKIFRKFWQAVVLGLGLSLSLASPAMAASLNYSEDTTLALTSPAINLTIVHGSVATSLVVDTGSFTVTVPASSTFTVTSASRDLNVTGASSAGVINASCSTGGVATLGIVAGTSAETVTITPLTAACSSTSTPSGGGVGYVSGGGGYTAPAPVVTPPVITAPAAPAGAHPNGTLVNDNGTIYLIQNGQRYGFRDAAEYNSHGYSFGQAVAASDNDKSLPTVNSNIIKALEGTLVLDAQDGKTVYMVGTGNTKRGFVSAAVFKALGYSFANLPKINLSDYTVGPVIGSGTETHPDGALVLDGKTVWWVLGGTRQGFESMSVFNTYGFPTTRIVKANAADLALPEGPLVKFRDGTLVNDGGTYYLISDGKKLSFISAADLAARGYKASNAISAGLSGYTSGGNVQ